VSDNPSVAGRKARDSSTWDLQERGSVPEANPKKRAIIQKEKNEVKTGADRRNEKAGEVSSSRVKGRGARQVKKKPCIRGVENGTGPKALAHDIHL